MEYFMIDITRIPFSRYGAYVSVTAEQGKNRLTIHNVRRRFEEGTAYTLRFLKVGKEAEIKISARPEYITVEGSDCNARIYIRDDMTVVIESCGFDLEFEQISNHGYGIKESENSFKMISVTQRIYYYFYIQEGYGSMSVLDENYHTNRLQRLTVVCENGRCVAALKMSIVEPKSIVLPIRVDEEIKGIKSEWEEYGKKLPNAGKEEEEFKAVTWYNIWSSFVRAEDVYQYDTMLMSKKHMSSVWSWDHCFNALAMAKVDKDTALQQFLAPFVIQAENGALPDMWNPNSEIVWGVTKPPIHGWCFSKLMDMYDFETNILSDVYGYLEKWTNWWMEYRDSDHDGIPEYPQGCDSGWDNATIFDLGYFIETPDLPAFLILQMRTLERISSSLYEMEKDKYWINSARKWGEEAKLLQKRFYEHSWDGVRFVAKQSRTHACEMRSTCLLALMPLVLGEQLDEEMREKLVVILKEEFLTEYGLATESPTGGRYEPDGYWRGPIWAPPTYLIIDGLRKCGYEELAREIAARFCRMASQIAKGNYENYDALSGKGLRAPGYTWTASVYMLLCQEYKI